MHELPEHGAMLAARAPVERLLPLLRDPRLALAADNGPLATVVSGATDAVAALEQTLTAAAIPCKRLPVSHAFHSPLMEPMLAPLAQAAARLTPRAPTVPLVANLDGAFHATAPDANYWRQHTRQPVRFSAGIATLEAAGIDVYLELGAHSTLIDLGRRAARAPALWLTSLRRDQPDLASILDAVGALHVRGAQVTWAAVNGPAPHPRPELPTYPFDRRRFWFSEGVDMNHINDQSAPASSARGETILRELQQMAAGGRLGGLDTGAGEGAVNLVIQIHAIGHHDDARTGA